MADFTLWHGDCLEEMDRIEDGSIDAIIADLPYGTTACAFDVRIPFEPLWKQYKRIIKPRGAVVLFGSEPFSSLLRVSNLGWYKYDWIWEKDKAANILNANRQPLKIQENVAIFSNGQSFYNPQKTPCKPYRHKNRNVLSANFGKNSSSYDPNGYTYYDSEYPKNVIRFAKDGTIHPEQKPVKLLEFLIKTYTNEGDTILDNTCGSGSTLEAAMRNNRHSIGIEKDAHYFSVAQQRLARVVAELRGELTHLPMFSQ